MRRPGWRLALATAAGLFLLSAVRAPGQDAEKKPPSAAFLQGTEAFRRILYDMENDLYKVKVAPLETFNDLDDPKHTLLIVFGDADRLDQIPGGVEEFVRRGGALFLATDRRLPRSVEADVRALTGSTVTGTNFTCDAEAGRYRSLDYCPLVRPQSDAMPDLFRNLVPPGGDVSSVATNVPSSLHWTRGGLPILAWLPEPCKPEGSKGPFDDGQFLPPLFGVGGDKGDGGRVLLLADHSIFINEMIMQEDNGNLDFSYNCLKWMTEGPNGPRTRVLFVEDDRINSKFDVPLKDMPDELAERLLGFVASLLEVAGRKAGPFLERKARAFDDQLPRWCYEMGMSPFGVLLIVLAAAVVLYGCWKVGWRARYRSDLQGPLLATALHRVAPAGTVTEQRRFALLVGGNLWEPARDLARQFLMETGARSGASPPPVVVRGGWLRRWTTANRIRRLWRLASGTPVRVRRGEWQRLLRQVRELKAAFADGTIQWR